MCNILCLQVLMLCLLLVLGIGTAFLKPVPQHTLSDADKDKAGAADTDSGVYQSIGLGMVMSCFLCLGTCLCFICPAVSVHLLCHGSAGDTAWMLASGAMVFIMTPGLSLFYGGMVR